MTAPVLNTYEVDIQIKGEGYSARRVMVEAESFDDAESVATDQYIVNIEVTKIKKIEKAS